jgi:2-amino-4-hydroxy-6-hydroxymethyldihydropteridine diphosphokinase
MGIIGIEREMGRIRSGESYTDRIIDIDILFYNNLIINTKELTIPHPRLHERRFVLVPLAEIAEDFIHPVFEKSIIRLLQECEDSHSVNLLN